MSRHRLPDAAGTPARPTPSTVAAPLPREAAHSRTAGAHSIERAQDAATRADTAAGPVEALSRIAGRRHAVPAARPRHRPGYDPSGPGAANHGRSRHAQPRADRSRRSRPRPTRLGGGRRAAMVVLAVTVGIVALPAAGSAAVDQCRWRVAGHDLLVGLDGLTDSRSIQLRTALERAGVDETLPAECAPSAAAADTAAAPVTAPTSKATAPAATKTPATKTAAATAPATTAITTTTPSTTAGAAAPAPAGPGTGTTAAQKFGWGNPTRSDDFSAGLSQWGVYDGAGHAGNGRRTPSAVSVANGLLTISGRANGDSGGMAWGNGQKYGRWEARVRSTAGDDNYHPVLLMWPEAENWPVGGEIDWMEISDPTRRTAETFLHYGSSNNQVQGDVQTDATQWHNWAVEWTPEGVTTYLDGQAWWSTRNTSILPPGPMHMTIQLDNFGGGNMKPSQMQVDWVKQYAP